jgi:tRNA nucleotidyltransferase (CCA-adding enzyme)
MQIYLVGGAVRDKLMGLPTKDKDWVVVGSTPEELCQKGFKPVGKDFPVFLHPETHEEYALARTERKTAKGYKGFTFYFDTDVTLEQDLQRRDLTINAIAESPDGQLIDPYNGHHDIQKKVFNHVSSAFSEDPVRILRVARFASRFPDFKVHKDTNTLMKTMANNGEVDALVTERIWQELSRALSYAQPIRFFEVLIACHAHKRLWPEITPTQLNALQRVSDSLSEPHLRFAALLQSLKTLQVSALIKRLHPPKVYKNIAECTNKHHSKFLQIDLSCAKAIWNLYKATDALRQPEKFNQFCQVCDRLANHSQESNKTRLLQHCLYCIRKIDTHPIQQKNLTGTEFAQALSALQIQTINDHIK